MLISYNFCLGLRPLLVLSVMEQLFIILFAVIFDIFEDCCSLQVCTIHTNPWDNLSSPSFLFFELFLLFTSEPFVYLYFFKKCVVVLRTGKKMNLRTSGGHLTFRKVGFTCLIYGLLFIPSSKIGVSVLLAIIWYCWFVLSIYSANSNILLCKTTVLCKTNSPHPLPPPCFCRY